MSDYDDKLRWENKLHKAAADVMRKHGILGYDDALRNFKRLGREACNLKILTDIDVSNILGFEAFRWFTVYHATPADEVWTLRKNYH